MTQPVATPAVVLREQLGIARASLRTERKHLERLLVRLAADEAQAESAPRLREMGEVLKVQQSAVPRGADRVRLAVPWEPERLLDIELRRDLSPAANVERFFRRARGFDQGLRMIAERRDIAVSRLAEVRSLEAAHADLLALAEQPPAEASLDLRALAAEGRAWKAKVAQLRLKVEPRPAVPPATQKLVRKAGGALPEGVQLFTSPAGRTVLVGRSAAGNDAVVTRLMRGRDLWLHVLDRTGAHVVLRVEPSKPVEDADVQACAILAAHLSGIEKGDRVDVQCVAGKHVRKVKGAPPGAVYTSQGRSLRIEVNGAVVDGFYARRAAQK